MYFTYNQDIEIYYEKHGKGKINVILLHGFACSHLNWHKIIHVFNPDIYTVYNIDLKGYGESSRPHDNKYSLSHQATIIEAFILKLNLRKVIVTGHSMGGGVAIYLAISHLSIKNRLKGLILLDSAAYKDYLPLFARILKVPVLRNLVFVVMQPRRFIVRWAIRRIFYNKEKVTEDIVDAYLPYFYHKDARYVYVKTVEQLIPDNSAEMVSRFSGITLPVRIIWGENDKVIPLRLGRKLHDNIPGSELKIIPRCGHNIQEEKPAETMQFIKEFLAKL